MLFERVETEIDSIADFSLAKLAACIDCALNNCTRESVRGESVIWTARLTGSEEGKGSVEAFLIPIIQNNLFLSPDLSHSSHNY